MVTAVAARRAWWSSPWVKLAASALLLTAVLWRADWRDTSATIANADRAWLAAALGVYLLSQALSAGRWWVLTRAVGFRDSPARIAAYYFCGMYLNLFGPGTVTGDLGRALYLAAGHRRALALTTVLAHRALGFVALVWVSSAGLVVTHTLPVPPLARWLAVLAIPLTLLTWLVAPRLAARLLPRAHHWRALIERDLAPYWFDRRLLAISLILAAAVHAGMIGSQMAIAQALGLRLPLSFFWVVTPLLNAAATLPFSFSGFGVREAGYWMTLGPMGVGTAPAIAVGLLNSAVVFIGGLSGLPCFLQLRRPRPYH